MSDIVSKAESYATGAHQRISHTRKYSNDPYQVHLKAVAEIVASVTDDPETIAAAWLHDTVEDTTATLLQIEKEFGPGIAELVEELTDVSKPGDGNRAVRKEMDRQHLAQASAKAKTVKLADLIDNCKDITRHDPRFAPVYLEEMSALLEVLQEGDEHLLEMAYKVYEKSIAKLSDTGDHMDIDVSLPAYQKAGFHTPQFRRMFSESFTARDIAEPLLSFDMDTPCKAVKKHMKRQHQDMVGIRSGGTVVGYVRKVDLSDGVCADHLRHLSANRIVDGSTSLSDVIHVLTRYDYCFVSMLGQVMAVICRDDFNKPMVRMWLFGIITMVEMGLTRLIEERFPDDSWQQHMSAGRLEKVKQMHEERQRRNLNSRLLDCMQFSDKGYLLIGDPQSLKILGFDSRSVARKVIKELESLRNHLAHAQDIVSHDWAQIARMSQRLSNLEV
jgi:hypothetical protein